MKIKKQDSCIEGTSHDFPVVLTGFLGEVLSNLSISVLKIQISVVSTFSNSAKRIPSRLQLLSQMMLVHLRRIFFAASREISHGLHQQLSHDLPIQHAPDKSTPRLRVLQIPAATAEIKDLLGLI